VIFYFQDTVRKIDALKSLRPNSKYTLRGDVLEWHSDNEEVKPSDTEITNEITRLQAEYDALAYARNRKAEYPTIEELVVALYDTDDKSAIEAKRAEVKAKYPKT